MNKDYIKTTIYIVLLTFLTFVFKSTSSCSKPGGLPGSTIPQKPDCSTLTMDTKPFTFNEVHLKYNLYEQHALESDRIELGAAHSGFDKMIGEVSFLSNILVNSNNYQTGSKPSISADFSFSNCSGKYHKVYTIEEIIGNTLYGSPYQPFKLNALDISVKSIRTSNNFQLVWPGKANLFNDLWGDLNIEGKSIVINMSSFANTTTNPGSFAGNYGDGNELDYYDNTLVEDIEDFVDSIVEVTIDTTPFFFSSTLSKSVYYHGFYNENVRWHNPIIFNIVNNENVEEEDSDDEDEQN